MKRIIIFPIFLIIMAFADAQIVINEFMAGNVATIIDESNEYEDWIEIYNSGNTAINLSGYYLTDNYANPLKFAFSPAISIGAKSYLVLFADDDGNQGNLHANFKLSLDGEEIAIYKLSGIDTILIDSLTYEAQSNDISYGRFPDGNEYCEFFPAATPGTANISGNLEGIAPMPVFSVPGGFYTSSQSVEITTDLAGAQIRYTTDGSEPTASSTIYSTLITRDTTFILKAKVFAENYAAGKTHVSTYFINEHFCSFSESERLPVVSISCNNDYLYHESTGLLTNAFVDMEKMVNIELFEPDGGNAINQYSGLKVYGNATRSLDQKSLAAFARSKYGKGSFEYKFFDDKPFDEYESIVFRNGGSDWSLTYFRDALCQALVRERMDIDAQGIKHAILYLNGIFYGIIEIIEKVNEHYVEQNYNVNVDNIDMVNHTSTGEEVICGDLVKYNEFKNFMIYSDMSSPVLYRRLEKLMNTKNFMNIQMAQIYIANIDMFLNSKYWRERVNYGKWRWIMYDTELSFGQGDYSYADDYGTVPSSNTLAFASESFGHSGWPYYRPWSSEKLQSILRNESFRNDFIQTFAVHINTTFKPSRILNMIDSMQQYLRNEIPYQIAKYGGREIVFNPYGIHFTTMAEWEYYVDIMRDFAIRRPDYMRSFIIERFALEGMYQLTPAMNIAAGGSIFIQDIYVPCDSSGIYFNDVPLRISAVSNKGYRFVKWQGLKGIDSLSSEITVALSEDSEIEAVFAEEGNTMITEIFYQPSAGNSEFIEIKNPQLAATLDISKYSLSGDINFTFPDSTFLSPAEIILVAADKNFFPSPYTRVYQWESGNLNDTTGIVVIKDNSDIIIDSVHYSGITPWPVVTENNSIELISVDMDNNIGDSWKSGMSQGGSAGIPAFSDAIKLLKINEYMSNNSNIIADEKGGCNDWIEIVNMSNEKIDFGGLFITNDLIKPGLYQVPVNSPELTTINPGEYKILWADDEKEQGALHLGFKLSASGGAIGLSADSRNIFESVSYSLQPENVSSGRYENGTGDWEDFAMSTPGYKNTHAPEFTSDPLLWCQQGVLYEYSISAIDEDGDELAIGFVEKPYWATITNTGNGTAILRGTMPGGVVKVFNVKVFVTDGYTEPVVQTFKITRGVAPVGIFEESLALNQFSCYPNPTDGLLNIEALTNSTLVKISINNIAGQVVFMKHISATNGRIYDRIDLSGQKKGIYYLTISSDEGTVTEKVILF